MDLHFYISVAVMIVGLVMFLATTGKPSEVGKLMFFAGILVTLLRFAATASLHIK